MPPNSEELNLALAKACVTLGLAPPFDADKAKSRYRELAKLYHPDVGVQKNSARFAEISQAYELIENHFQTLSEMKLSIAVEMNAEHSRTADLLQQLHQARAKTLSAENSVRQMAEESQALRRQYGDSRKTSRSTLVAAVFIGAAAMALGFLAGMVWSSTSPIVKLKPGQTFLVNGEVTSVTQDLLNSPDMTTRTMNVKWGGPLEYQLTFGEGTVVVEDDAAEVKTTPTIQLIRLPSLDISVVPPARTTPQLTTSTVNAPVTAAVSATATVK